MKKFMLSLFFICLSGLFLFFTAFVKTDSFGIEKLISVTVAAAFWLSAIAGYIFLFLSYKIIKKDDKKRKLGIISIFTNRYAFYCDIILFISVFATVVLSIFDFQNAIVYTALISVIYLSFNLHCILNGRVFNRYLSK